MKKFLSFFCSLFFIGCSTNPPLPTVKNLDIKRYMGQWYEIAKYPNKFQKNCPLAKAIYTFDGQRVHVNNICLDKDGNELRRAKGKANIIGDGKLEVSFFWPFYGDYWVIMLADDYRYSVVGDPKRKYLWILSREKMLKEEDKQYILNNLEKFGYDKEKLVWNRY